LKFNVRLFANQVQITDAVRNVAMADQITCLNLTARKIGFKGKTKPQEVDNVRAKVKAIV